MMTTNMMPVVSMASTMHAARTVTMAFGGSLGKDCPSHQRCQAHEPCNTKQSWSPIVVVMFPPLLVLVLVVSIVVVASSAS